MLNKMNKIVLLFLLAGMIIAAGCNRNYYSGSGGKGKDCGCPANKGMGGY